MDQTQIEHSLLPTGGTASYNLVTDRWVYEQ